MQRQAGGVALADGLAFSGNRGGSVVCAEVDTGRVRWTHSPFGAELFATPAVCRTHVVVVPEDGSVHALLRADRYNRFAFIFNTPGDKYQKAQIFIEMAIKMRMRLRFREWAKPKMRG